MSFLRSLSKIETHDMHTAGEPLRIIKPKTLCLPDVSVIEKRDYVRSNLDFFRKLLINEPRGHNDMYGAIIEHTTSENEFDVLFLNNDGYSSMCGHAVIALGRYVVDFGLVSPPLSRTEITFNCPCGPVKTIVETFNNIVKEVRFESVPAFAYKLDIQVHVPKLGIITVDVSYGGAYYVIVTDKTAGINLQSSPLKEIVNVASNITNAVKEQVSITHPFCDKLAFLYGTIITDGKDEISQGPSRNVCVFANKQVDRSPTGSGVTARLALQFKKGVIGLNEQKTFKSLIDTSFIGKCLRETTIGPFSAVIVEVSGMAYHTGDHTFYLEDNDPLKDGFQINC